MGLFDQSERIQKLLARDHGDAWIHVGACKSENHKNTSLFYAGCPNHIESETIGSLMQSKLLRLDTITGVAN